MKQIKLLLFLSFISGCSSVIKGVTGNFSHFDSNEYYQTVELRVEVSESRKLCNEPLKEIRNQILRIDKRLMILKLYASDRSYNTLMIDKIDKMKKEIEGVILEINSGNFNYDYCSDITENLEEMSESLRKISGGKKQ